MVELIGNISSFFTQKKTIDIDIMSHLMNEQLGELSVANYIWRERYPSILHTTSGFSLESVYIDSELAKIKLHRARIENFSHIHNPTLRIHVCIHIANTQYLICCISHTRKYEKRRNKEYEFDDQSYFHIVLCP